MLDAAQPRLPLPDHGPPATPPERARGPARAEGEAAELRAARQAFLGLVARWALSGQEALALLGEPGAGEKERRERLGALLGVHRSLLMAHPDPDRCLGVLRRPCPALDGASPLQAMLAGGLPAIARVRAHLAGLAAA